MALHTEFHRERGQLKGHQCARRHHHHSKRDSRSVALLHTDIIRIKAIFDVGTEHIMFCLPSWPVLWCYYPQDAQRASGQSVIRMAHPRSQFLGTNILNVTRWSDKRDRMVCQAFNTADVDFLRVPVRYQTAWWSHVRLSNLMVPNAITPQV